MNRILKKMNKKVNKYLNRHERQIGALNIQNTFYKNFLK